MTTLGNERGGNATTQHVQYTKQFWAHRRRGAPARPRRRPARAPAARVGVHPLRDHALPGPAHAVGGRRRARSPGPAASINKMFWSEYAQRFAEIMMNLRGADGMVRPDGRRATRPTAGRRSSSPPGRSRSGAAPRRCSATSSASGCSACPRSPAPSEERRRMTAEAFAQAADCGMTLAWWAEQQPDAARSSSEPATARSPSSTPTPTGSTRALRRAGHRRAATRSPCMVANRPEFAEMVAAAQRGGFRFTHRQLAPHRRRGRLHRRRLRGQASSSPTPRSPRSPARSRRRRRVCGSLLAVGGAIDGFEHYDAAVAAEDGADIDDPVLGQRDALHLGHDRPAQGRAPRRRPAPVRRSQHLRLHARASRRAPVHRPALPRRTARLLARGPAERRAPPSWSWRTGTAEETLRLIDEHGDHPHAHGADDVPPPALACPPTCAPAPTCRRCSSCSTARRRARCSVKQRLIDWLGPIVVEYYAATEGRRQLRRLDDVAHQAGHGRSPTRPTRSACSTTRTATAPRRSIGARLPQGAARRRASTTSRIRARRRRATGATTSRSATSATSTATATCSSPTARPTSSSRAA